MVATITIEISPERYVVATPEVDLDRYEITRFGQTFHTGGPHGYVAYIPEPVPLDLEILKEVLLLATEAEAALAELNGVGRLLPNTHLLANPFLRREALSSTRIEGRQASLVDLFAAEAIDQAYRDDISEVVNYVDAFEHGIRRLRDLPLSIRLAGETMPGLSRFFRLAIAFLPSAEPAADQLQLQRHRAGINRPQPAP